MTEKGNLKELLKKKGDAPAEEAAEKDVTSEVTQIDPGAVLKAVEKVEVEAVVGGALMRITFGRINPANVKGALLALDPTAKVRDDFPKRGNFGPKETKQARCVALNLRVTDGGKFISLLCQNGDDFSVSVSKKNSDAFLGELTALGRLGERHLAKVAKAFEDKGEATVILPEDEQFGVNYWSTDDGKHFLDGMTPEPPAEKEADNEGKEKGDD